MMTARIITVIGVTALAGAGSFLVGRQTSETPAAGPNRAGMIDGKPCCKHAALCNFLKLTVEQRRKVRATDSSFVDEAGQLSEKLAAERKKLEALLEDTSSTDEAIMAQIERVIASHDALERRVASHMLAIRPILTPDQAKQLMGLAANGVRNAGRCRGESWDAPAGSGPRGGGGRGGGGGQGRHGWGGRGQQ